VRRLLLSFGAVTFGLAVGLAATVPLAHGDARPQTISVDEIKDGMKGYGLTVFKGTEPERFDVEVVGVLHNFRPSQDLILVKTPHPRLNITKNVRGMSGSPIYFDGRLAGAYAYSWAMFQAEPVAGVTPIAPMLTEMRRPIPAGFWPLEGTGPLPKIASAKQAGLEHARASEGLEANPQNARTRPSGESATAFRGGAGRYSLEAHQKELAERFAVDPGRPVVPVSTPMMIGGVGERTQAFVRQMFAPLGLEPMAAGGGQGSTEGAPEHYVNGGALGVSMVSGDVSFFGLGTVTHVEGRKLCGFGHPMMEAGVTALPTSIGRVHWIFASDQHSSKIGESARPLGALVQDRQSAVIADESKVAPTFPMSVEVLGALGAPKTSWKMVVAEERFMSPGLVAAALAGALEATTNERRDVSWKLTSVVSIRGYGNVDLEDIGIAVGGMPDASDWSRSRLVRVVGEVVNNPWENAHIERIETKLTVQYTKDVYQLRGVDVLDPVVDPGEKARLVLRLLPFAGAPVLRTVQVTLPAELAGKEVEVEILPGFESIPETPAPENLRQLLANATKFAAPRTIVLQLRLPGAGLTYQQHVAPRLPPFALDALRPQNTDVLPEAFTNYARTTIPMDHFVDGRDRVKIRVRNK
jgi:SpoIVB peptidase S55